MNPPQKPVRPPKPPPVPKDQIPDAGKMLPTPRTDAAEQKYGDVMHAHCHDSTHLSGDFADFARQLERELAAANAEVANLKAGGCARDQRTTQWCAEAVELAKRLDEANARYQQRIAELEQWIRGLDTIAINHAGGPGAMALWLNPGQCVFVGLDKPYGLR